MNNYLYVTHVEIQKGFLKIHGQTNSSAAAEIESKLNISYFFQIHPPPLLNMLNTQNVFLINWNSLNYRGRITNVFNEERIKVLLIDHGNIVTVAINDIRRLESNYLNDQPLASSYILSHCAIKNDNILNRIIADIRYKSIPFAINEKIHGKTFISLFLNGSNYAFEQIKLKNLDPMPFEKQKSLLCYAIDLPRPVRTPIESHNSTMSSQQFITNHLNNNKVPQNMPSYQPKIIPPIVDRPIIPTPAPAPVPAPARAPVPVPVPAPAPVSVSVSTPATANNFYQIPAFIKDTLVVNQKHQVVVSHIEDGPCIFSVQLKSSEKWMQQMIFELNKYDFKQLSHKPSIGMACIVKYKKDDKFYRAVITSFTLTFCNVNFVDYGYNDQILIDDMYDIPEEFLKYKIFAHSFSLAESKKLPKSDDHSYNFRYLVNGSVLDMHITPSETLTFVQKCTLTLDGKSVLDHLNDLINNKPRYLEPPKLKDNDCVIIRYVESPKLFYVQQTKNILPYNVMMDGLMQSCSSSCMLNQFEIGTTCAARYKNDAEWYRAEIIKIFESLIEVCLVDYGITVTAERQNLRQIPYSFIKLPKQAVQCCLYGFDTMKTLSHTSQDQMELLVEDSIGERRNFRVKIYSQANDILLVNLFDESQTPILDLSHRMLQLCLSQKSFRQYEIQRQNELTTGRKNNVNDSAIDSLTPDSSENKFERNRDETTSSGISSSHSPSHSSEKTTSNESTISYSSDSKELRTPKSKRFSNAKMDEIPYTQRNVSRLATVNTLHTSNKRSTDEIERIQENVLIPHEEIKLNNKVEVQLSYWVSPLDFYVNTIESDIELCYTKLKKDLHYFYNNKKPTTEKLNIGSYVVAKYSKNDKFERGQILDYNQKQDKYKVYLIDNGAKTIVDSSCIFDLDQSFSHLKQQAIQCCLINVAMGASKNILDEIIHKYVANKSLMCKFIKRKANLFYVDVEANGKSLRESLINDNYLSILPDDIQLERLVGQCVMAKFVNISNLSSFRLTIFGCDTVFEASCKDWKKKTTEYDFNSLNKKELVPIRIDSLGFGQTLTVTPLIESLNESTTPYLICDFPFFSDEFSGITTHWESVNVVYVHSTRAQKINNTLLERLFKYYEVNGEVLSEFKPTSWCAVKSYDLNWYRAQILTITDTHVNIRYLDYGNCELIPKSLVRRLESEFLDISALAVKVYLPIKSINCDNNSTLNELVNLTRDQDINIKVLELYAQNWIVDIIHKNVSLTQLKDISTTMDLDELRKQINSNIFIDPSPEIIQNTETVNQPQLQSTDNKEVKVPNSIKINAIVSHVDRPDRFYLQITSMTEELECLQQDIQIVAASLPSLEDFNVGTNCIVRYSVDDQWYRATIIDSDSKITSIQFIDYGNTDTITDNSYIKTMNNEFNIIPAYAIPCSLPLEVKDRNEWCDESSQLLKDLINESVDFQYVCHGKTNNLVKLYYGDRDIMKELIDQNYALPLETIKSGGNCYVSHVNSISDFFVQMEDSTDALKILEAYLSNESQFPQMTHIKEGILCAARFLDDNCLYRAKVKSHSSDCTEVFFIDYGNSAITNELRLIPPEIANAPTLAKYCSLAKPLNILCWSEEAEQTFRQRTECEKVFKIDVISPGKKSIVDLIENNKSIVDELIQLSNQFSLHTLESTFQSNRPESETVKAYIVVVTSPEEFYIQLDSVTSELDQMCLSMKAAVDWPKLSDVSCGTMCAAFFEDAYYRATVVHQTNDEISVLFIDYGNVSTTMDLRKLPEDIAAIEPLAILCSLDLNNQPLSPELIKRFHDLPKDGPFEIKFISKTPKKAQIQLFQNGLLFGDGVLQPVKLLKRFKAYISDRTSPSHFYIQLNNDMEDAMSMASNYPPLDECDKRIGKLCAALYEGSFFRANIISIDEQGVKVHFIDYGNEDYTTDLRKLPDDLECIERASILCALEMSCEQFPQYFIDKFLQLDLNEEYEFEIVCRTELLNVVRLYVAGDLFSYEKNVNEISQTKIAHHIIDLTNDNEEEGNYEKINCNGQSNKQFC